jgi:hypothetical protein
MNLLITPAQVAALAFKAPDFITEESIAEATILAAEQKFIRPVLGDALCDALCRGTYPDLLETMVRPPLALYIKMLMLPSLSLQTGPAGVVEVNSKQLATVGDARLRTAMRGLRGEAGMLVVRLTKHLDSNLSKYPEYNPDNNIVRRCSIDGGIVIPKNKN